MESLEEDEYSLFRPQSVRHAQDRSRGGARVYLPPSILGASLAVGATVLVLVAFAAFVTVPRIEQAEGRVAPVGGLLRISAQRGGVVESLRAEGDRVSRGDVLATLTLPSEAVSGDTSIVINSEAQAGLAAQARALDARLEVVNAQSRALRRRMALLQVERTAAEQRIALSAQALGSAEKEYARYEELKRRGFMSQANLEGRQGAMTAAKEAVSRAQTEVRRVQLEIEDVRSELDRLVAVHLQTTSEGEQLAAAERERIAQLRAGQGAALLSPAGGRVSTVAVGRGQAVEAGRTLMWLVPAGNALEVELYIPARIARLVSVGQEVRFRVQGAGPRDPSYLGKLASMSPAAVDPVDLGLQADTFKEPIVMAKVALPPGLSPSLASIKPGLHVSADLVLDKVAILSLIFPDHEHRRRGGESG